MTILFDATKSVKPAPRTFGQGLARPGRATERRAPYNDADLHFVAAVLNANTTQYEVTGMSDAGLERIAENTAIDQAAGCALATARHSAGWAAF